MQAHMLPKKVCNDIDAASRAFIWEGMIAIEDRAWLIGIQLPLLRNLEVWESLALD